MGNTAKNTTDEDMGFGHKYSLGSLYPVNRVQYTGGYNMAEGIAK